MTSSSERRLTQIKREQKITLSNFCEKATRIHKNEFSQGLGINFESEKNEDICTECEAYFVVKMERYIVFK